MEYVLLWILFAVFSGVIAKSKNKDVFLWALIGLFFGPFGLVVAFLPSEEESSSKTSKKQKIRCKVCQEVIHFNTKICRHCGAHFPYLSEPARSHVELIKSFYVKGDSPATIAEALNAKRIRPASEKYLWVAGGVAQIIGDHIS